MFSEKQINAYKNISAPNELRSKVMSASAGKKRFSIMHTVSAVAAVAACFALIAAVVLTMQSPTPEIVCNGQVLEESVLFYDISPASDMRASPVFSVPFEFILGSDTNISVSYGRMILSDGTSVDGAELCGDVSLWWEIPRSEDIPTCEMELTVDNCITVITLTFDNAE